MKSAVLTFLKHPLTEIFPRYAPKLLSNNNLKEQKIKEKNIDFVFFEPFTNELRKNSPRNFIENFILKKFNIDTLVVGFNYNFGYKGSGNIQTLTELGKLFDFQVVIVDPLLIDDDIVSSTRIRNLLAQGKVDSISKLLGNDYTIEGIIEKGKQLGRQYGIPTANLKVDSTIQLPKSGVYYTKIIIDGKEYDGLTNLGNNPTFPDHPYSIETYIFDFDQSIYGKRVQLKFKNFIRGERKFDSIDDLVTCIQANIQEIEEKYRKK